MSKSVAILLGIFLGGVRYLFYDDFFLTATGLGFSLFIVLRFIDLIGRVLPIKEFVVMIASLQWIVGAKISYSIGKVHYKYYMYVEEETYMYLVVPGILLFYLGLFAFKLDLKLGEVEEYFKRDQQSTKRLSRILLLLGVFALVMEVSIKSPSLSFIIYLLSLVVYIGVIHMFYVYPKHKTLIFGATLIYSFLQSLGTGVFHSLLILSSFLMFYYFTNKSSMTMKLSIILIGVSFIYIIQIVKPEYRETTWSDQTEELRISTFYDIVKKEFLLEEPVKTTYVNPNFTEVQEQSEINARFNQGWIISRIINNVPKNEPFQNGSTIINSLESSLLPRILVPDKKGGDYAKETFNQLTGYKLGDKTSMGLSTIGEFYANYGFRGAWLAMFIYGLFLSFIIWLIVNIIGKNNKLILLWFPLFFFQVVKAESNFITIFNHLVKSLILFYAIRYLVAWVYNVNLFPTFKLDKIKESINMEGSS